MLQYTRPEIQWELRDFKNLFITPINDGQHRDASKAEKIEMSKAIYKLQTFLSFTINRADIKILIESLPKKTEFALKIRWTQTQIQLIESLLRLSYIKNNRQMLFKIKEIVLRIAAHPSLLLDIKDQKIEKVIYYTILYWRETENVCLFLSKVTNNIMTMK